MFWLAALRRKSENRHDCRQYLGRNPHAGAGQGQPPQLLYLVQAHVVCGRRRRQPDGERAECALQRLDYKALLGRDQRSFDRGESCECRGEFRGLDASRRCRAALVASGRSGRIDHAAHNLGRGFESAVHVRHVHRGIVESVCARRVPRGCGSAVAVLQSPVYLWRSGSRKDAPDARGWSLCAAARSEFDVDLHFVRAIHERDDQRRAVRPPDRLSRTLPHGGRPAGG